MKKVIIGGFLALIGSVWMLITITWASNTQVSSWTTPPGKFLTIIYESGAMWLFVIAILLIFVGMLIMFIEYFKK